MANPAVTYTFSNGTTADATQANTNFTDLINALTDSTKSLAIDALTCAGAATFNGNVTFGNGSVDDITFTGSLASSIPIKTNASFNFGSATLGLASVYLGSAGGFTTRLIGGATSASWSLTLPANNGNAKDYLETDGNGVTSWVPPRRTVSHASNYSLACSVGTNALTIALKGLDGNDPSATNPVDILFRNETATSGIPVLRTVTSATSLVISSGSTLGHTSAVAEYIYVYAYDVGDGSVQLAVSSTLHDDGTIAAVIIAEGGAGAADLASALYATGADTNVPIRLIGRLKSTQSTAGTWAAVPSEVTVYPTYSDGKKERYVALVNTDTPYTALESNDVIACDATSGVITVNLPAVATCKGKIYTIKKTDATTNAVTIDGNAAETVGGSATRTLNTINEVYKILCTGTAWIILEHHTLTDWTAWTPVHSWDADADVSEVGFWRRNGDTAEYYAKISMTGAPATAALTITLPTGHEIDSAKIDTTLHCVSYGEAAIVDAGVTSYVGHVLSNGSTTVVKVSSQTGTSTANATVTQASPITFGTGDSVSVKFSVPIVGWTA